MVLRSEILLRLAGWRKIERVLQGIDIVEALGIDLSDATPEHGAIFTTIFS